MVLWHHPYHCLQNDGCNFNSNKSKIIATEPFLWMEHYTFHCQLDIFLCNNGYKDLFQQKLSINVSNNLQVLHHHIFSTAKSTHTQFVSPHFITNQRFHFAKKLVNTFLSLFFSLLFLDHRWWILFLNQGWVVLIPLILATSDIRNFATWRSRVERRHFLVKRRFTASRPIGVWNLN